MLMVLIFPGSSYYDAHKWREIGNLFNLFKAFVWIDNSRKFEI